MSFYLKILTSFFIGLLCLPGVIFAQEDNSEERTYQKLDYGGDVVVDMDLDGLTDLGENMIFGTDPKNPDTDGDGFYDGVEVIKNTNPFDNISPVATKVMNTRVVSVENETPWIWYINRASGLIAFLLLYLVMLLGAGIRNPILKKIIKPIYSLRIHAWLSVQMLVFVLLHSMILVFDKFVNVNILDVLIPFASDFKKNEVALGVLGMYTIIILIVTSYFRKKLPTKLWRKIHYLNMFLYIVVAVHSLIMGTDLQAGFLRNAFIYANVFLVIIIVVNILTKIFNNIRSSKIKSDENLRESNS